MTSFARNAPHPVIVGLTGAFAMAAAMGFGRFSYTPILPGMMSALPLSASDAGLIAGGNFAGYLAGAVLSAFGFGQGRERVISLASLLATAILLAAMALVSSVEWFTLIRFLAGVASALCMIFTSSIVLAHVGSQGRHDVQALHFSGVGMGIALSSLAVLLVGMAADGAPDGWRLEWLAGAIFALAVFLGVWRFLPHARIASADVGREPPLRFTGPMVLTVASYGLFGFGYVITATFLVTMARMGSAGPAIEFYAWFATGCAGALSLFAWKPLVARHGLASAYSMGMVVLCIGVLASVALPPAAGAVVGGLFLGATFMVVTAYGLQFARRLSPQSPRRGLALMTAAFGLGQIVGPVVAGWIAGMTGSFVAPTLIAAIVLAISTGLSLPLLRVKTP